MKYSQHLELIIEGRVRNEKSNMSLDRSNAENYILNKKLVLCKPLIELHNSVYFELNFMKSE